MTDTQITVKNVDEETFKELKATAIKNKMNVGSALSIAMHEWVQKMNVKREKLLDFVPFKGGKGTERLSEQVDEILYG
jgi:DNA-binding transcriptional regulator LsrR (DeoR family)